VKAACSTRPRRRGRAAGDGLQLAPLRRVLPGRLRAVPRAAAPRAELDAARGQLLLLRAWDWRFLGLLWPRRSSTTRVRPRHRPDARRAPPPRLLFNQPRLQPGMLGFFKYFNFFADSLVDVFDAWSAGGCRSSPARPAADRDLVLHVHDDQLRRRRVSPGQFEPTRIFVDFALFVAFFPHLVAGPILRARRKLLPQIAAPRDHPRADPRGLWLIAWGLFQKVFVADNLGRSSPRRSSRPTARPPGSTCCSASTRSPSRSTATSPATRTSPRHLEADGHRAERELPVPVLRDSPREFWRHWHISLSTWLRDYLYIPLGGSRGQRGDAAQPDDHDAARRALARRRLDVRALGHSTRASVLSWRPVDRRAPGPSARRHVCRGRHGVAWLGWRC
jgi:hypothetical protein